MRPLNQYLIFNWFQILRYGFSEWMSENLSVLLFGMRQFSFWRRNFVIPRTPKIEIHWSTVSMALPAVDNNLKIDMHLLFHIALEKYCNRKNEKNIAIEKCKWDPLTPSPPHRLHTLCPHTSCAGGEWIGIGIEIIFEVRAHVISRSLGDMYNRIEMPTITQAGWQTGQCHSE